MSQRTLNIVITVDPEIPVPPLYYGGIERIVDMLIRGLVNAGCQVSLFANHESRVPAALIPYVGRRSNSLKDAFRNALQIKNYIRQNEKIDILHSFSRLAYLAFIMKSAIPKIQSYQRHITPRSIFLAKRLAANNITFTACSKFCAGTADFMGGDWQVIPNGVNIEKYQFNAGVSSDAPLVFLGRITRVKGVHTAIALAKKTKRRLLIAGNHAQSGRDYEYFKNEVLPHCDQKTIEYIGEVNDIQKSELLATSWALLFPIEWDEPFGIVMVEALACGTPVIAFSRGAVPEVIKHKVTGFVCNSLAEMIDAVGMIPLIERINCRNDAQERFSDKVIIDAYLKLYDSCIHKKAGRV